MKTRLVAAIVALTGGLLLAANVPALFGEEKVRVKMTGCLQSGEAPNTFVLTGISEGYTTRNETGQNPMALARTDDSFLLVADDADPAKIDLQKYVGKKVKVAGWFSGERSFDQARSDEPTSVIEDESAVAADAGSAGASEFRVTGIRTASGTCP